MIKIGCQGWNYEDWTTKAGGEFVFYPRGTKSGEMLTLYAEIYDTIEVDSTFYAVPSLGSVEGWYKRTPPNFTFSLKMPQAITHELQLNERSFPILDEFCESILSLKEKLAVILIQLPPQFDGSKTNAVNLRKFLDRLPENIKFAVEFRNREWLIEWTFDELNKHKTALCLVEGSWIPRGMMFNAARKLKADFAYIRFMGERDLLKFDKIYRHEDANLNVWAEEIKTLNSKETYVYFSNFYEGHAPASVNKLKKLLGQETIEPETLENQGSLF